MVTLKTWSTDNQIRTEDAQILSITIQHANAGTLYLVSLVLAENRRITGLVNAMALSETMRQALIKVRAGTPAYNDLVEGMPVQATLRVDAIGVVSLVNIQATTDTHRFVQNKTKNYPRRQKSEDLLVYESPTKEMQQEYGHNQRGYVRAQIEEVADGDTFRVRLLDSVGQHDYREFEWVRLLGVDTPERARDGSPSQPGAEEAWQFTTKHALSKIVYLDICTHARSTVKTTDLSPISQPLAGRTLVGRDLYGRLLAIAYVQHGDHHINLNKSIIASNHSNVAYRLSNQHCPQVSLWGRLERQTNPNHTDFAGSGSNSNINGLARIDDRPVLSSYHMRIGDTQFIIPPQFIRVSDQRTIEHVTSLRTRGSSKKHTGHGNKVIEVELHFANLTSINGIITVKGNKAGYMIPVAKDGKSYEYSMNGLRSLIAQFKRTPFLPIENEWLNDLHNIHAITLQNITVETMHGFPNNLVAKLTMLQFNWEVYLPLELDFGDTFNWPLFRHYYQNGLLTQNDRNNKPPLLTPMTGKTFMGKHDLKFKIADEQALHNRDQLTRTARTSTPPTREAVRTNYDNTLLGKADDDHNMLVAAMHQRQLHQQWLNSGATYQNWLQIFNIDKDNQLFFPEGSIQIPNPFIRIPLRHQNNIDGTNRIINRPQIGSTPSESSGPFLIDLNTDTRLINQIVRLGTAAKKKLKKIIDPAFEQQEQAYSDMIKSVTEDQLIMTDATIENLYVTSIVVSHENIISSLQALSQPTPVHQYIGSQDIYIRITMETTSRETIQALQTLAEQVGHLAREYRHRITSGFLDIENELINMFGVRSILIDSLSIQTSRGNPELFEIEMLLVDFDKTQRSRQALHPVLGKNDDFNNALSFEEIRDRMTTIENITENISTSAIRLEYQMQQLEIYPDLELPTYEEVNTVLDALSISGGYPNPSGARFVDPDFYIGVSETFRKKIEHELKLPHKMTLEDGTYAASDADGAGGILAHTSTPNDGNNGALELSPEATVFLNQLSEELGDWDVEIASEQPDKALAISNNNEYVRHNFIIKDTTEFSASQKTVIDIVLPAPTATEKREWGLDVISHPTLEQINQQIKTSVHKHWRGVARALKIKDAYAITKAIMEQESKWTQYGTHIIDEQVSGVAGATNRSAQRRRLVPLVSRSGDIGMMQIRAVSHYLDPSIGGGLNSALVRRCGWDWRFNIDEGVRIYRETYSHPSMTSVPAFNKYTKEWSIVAYNAGVGGARRFLTEQLNKERSFEAHRYYATVKPFLDKYMKNPANMVITGNLRPSSIDRLRRASVHLSEMQIPATLSTDTLATPAPPNPPRAPRDWSGFHNPASFDDTSGLVPELAIHPTLIPESGADDEDLVEEHTPQDSYESSCVDLLTYDMRDRLARAFPAFQMFIIDEGRWLTWHRLWDNLYGYNSISSINIHRSRKIVADTCVIEMNNTYNTLDQTDPNVRFGNYGFNLWNFLSPFMSPSEEMIEMRRRALTQLFLKTGARIHVRLGYGSNAANLPIVFNGTITEINIEETATIVAQGDGIQLTNKIPAEANQTSGGIFRPTAAEPRNLILSLLDDTGFFRRWIQEGIINMPHLRGITHFGNPKYSLISPSQRELAQNIYSAVKNNAKQLAWRDVPASATDWLWLPPMFALTGDEPDINIFLYDKTPWDVIQICALAIPDYIAAVHPFGLRSTLFYGKPYWGLAYKYEHEFEIDSAGNLISRSVKEKRKAYQQFRIYHSATDILDNKIKASEDGVYTNVIGMFSTGAYDNPVHNVLVSADTDIFPEKQRTKIVHTELKASANHSPWGTQMLANNVATSVLANSLKEMYKGHILVIGDPSVKPFDLCYLFDTYNEIAGNVEVRAVTQMLSRETGFSTEITPDACVSALDPWKAQRWQWVGMLGTALSFNLAGGISMAHLGRYISNAGVLEKINEKTLFKIAQRLNIPVDRANPQATLRAVNAALKANASARAALAKAQITGGLQTIKGLLPKVFTQVGGAIGRAGGSAATYIGKGALVAFGTVFGISILPKLLVMSALYVVTEGIIELQKRKLQNRQAVVINLLSKNGRQLSAGINGHKGAVVGDTQGDWDKFLSTYFGWLVNIEYEHEDN